MRKRKGKQKFHHHEFRSVSMVPRKYVQAFTHDFYDACHNLVQGRTAVTSLNIRCFGDNKGTLSTRDVSTSEQSKS